MIEQSTDITELAKALARAQGEFGTVPKTADNPFFKSKYADLPAVVQAATPILTQHGLSVTQMLGYEIETDTLTTRLMHSSGQWIESTMRLHMTKQDAQGHGSAVTYARRYAYMAMLGLVSDVDDDGNAASVPVQTGKNTTVKPVTTKRAAPKVDAPVKDAGALRSLFAIKDRGGNPVVPKEGDERHEWAGKILNRTVASFTDLSDEEITLLKKEAKSQAILSATPPNMRPSDYTGDESPF